MAWRNCACADLLFFSFACIDLKFCKQPPDHCRIINHGLDINYKVHNCACADLSFLDLHILTWNFLHSFLFVPATMSQAWVCSFHTKICGNCTSTLLLFVIIIIILLYIDGVVREVNTRVLDRIWKLVDGNDNGWELNQLLFVDDTVVVAYSERKLCQLVTEFGRVCERRKLRVNVDKSKVMRCTRNEDVCHRKNEGCKVLGALKGVMKNGMLEMNVKKVCMRKWSCRL